MTPSAEPICRSLDDPDSIVPAPEKHSHTPDVNGASNVQPCKGAQSRASIWWWNPTASERPLVHHPQAPFHLMDFLMKFRWIVIIPVVLPLSFMWARIHLLRGWIQARIRGEATERKHDAKVAAVKKRIRQRDPGADGLICTARPTFWSVSTRSSTYKRRNRFQVDLSNLADIIYIDVDNMRAKFEPYVDMGQITSTLIPLGVCVPVVPEYDDLTVGGLVCGYGIEGSSHKYGLFYDEVIQMELVLADGNVVVATRDNEHSDLFYAVPWSYGSIGLLVSVTMRLVPIKPYMKVTYYPVAGTMDQMGEYWKQFLVPTDRPWAEYVEGLIYSSTRGVIMTADYADEYEARSVGPVNRMGLWFKPWFHKHVLHNVLECSSDGAPVVEYVPTRDYYHRHTRSLYWEADLLVPMGNHPLFRWLLGWMMPPRVSFLKLTTIGRMYEYYKSRFVAQDILVPLRKTADCMKLMHDEYDIYPLWLCAHRVIKTRRGTMLDCEPDYDSGTIAQGDTKEAQMFTDLGIWFTPGHILRGEKFDAAEASNILEQWLIENHGYQTLYAVTELSEVDFWKMFDRTLYEKCRKRYKAVGNFMGVYYKVGKKTGSAERS